MKREAIVKRPSEPMEQVNFQKFCAWSGVICVTMFFVAFGLAGFNPPLSPSLTPEQVAAH